MQDQVVSEVQEDLQRRSEVGIKKYGVGLDRDDKSLIEWANEAYEEALDQCLYLKKLINELKKKDK